METEDKTGHGISDKDLEDAINAIKKSNHKYT